MASIINPKLSIDSDRVQNTAAISVSCDVEFTQFEVNAMTRLGLSYSLSCDLQTMDMLYPESVVAFATQVFPRVPRQGKSLEHATFDAVTTMNALHVYIFGKDTIIAELTLKNDESEARTVKRTPPVAVDLVA
jgi:hypothetical protein